MRFDLGSGLTCCCVCFVMRSLRGIREAHWFRRGLCFQKAKYWDQLPSLSSESKREDATARFLCRGFPYEFSRGIPCSAYTGTYPIPCFTAPALRLPTPSGTNLKNSLENLWRAEP